MAFSGLTASADLGRLQSWTIASRQFGEETYGEEHRERKQKV
jgi:hypothetical protein